MNKTDQLDLGLLRSPQGLLELERDGANLRTKGDQSEVFSIVEDVPILLTKEMLPLMNLFDEKYNASNEPWDYTRRAVEKIRHLYVAQKVEKLIGDGQRILDLGCALGQLTKNLERLAPEVWAVEISPTATRKAKKLLQEQSAWPGFRFITASATDLPFRDKSFRLVLLSDGLIGWELSPEMRQKALNEAHRVLEDGGYAILTDYLHPCDFEEHLENISRGPMLTKEVDFLGDRLGFQLAVNLKPVSHFWPFSKLLGSLRFNLFLSQICRLRGRRLSKHVAVVLQKQTEIVKNKISAWLATALGGSEILFEWTLTSAALL